MYTVDGITELLNITDDLTLDSYNAMRASLVEELVNSRSEFDSVTAELEGLRKEVERLKAANAALYSKIEDRLAGRPVGTIPDLGDDDSGKDDDWTEDKAVEEDVKAYITF